MAIVKGTPTIRPESSRDHASISRVVAAAFGSSIEAELVDRIRRSPHYVPETALVAELDAEVVGHVMISGARLVNDDGERRISMLSPLAVDPRHQRAGIGSALVRAVLGVAERSGEPLVILEGNPSYYAKFGFEHSLEYGIEIHLPDWAPPEAAQVIRLTSYDPEDPSLRGIVVYPPAFDGLD